VLLKEIAFLLDNAKGLVEEKKIAVSQEKTLSWMK
jgi:hypothetical protein